MRSYYTITLLSVIIMSLSSCDGGDGTTDFCDAVILSEASYLRSYIDERLDDLGQPLPTFIDPLGHEQNLIEFVTMLNDNNDCMTASILCYACIKTNPAQSEILINVIEGGVSTSKILDISTPADDDLFFVGIHNP